MAEFLLELLSEEIPARMQAGAARDLERLTVGALTDRGFLFEGAKAFGGPRRLTLSIVGLPAKQNDVREELKGPKTDAPAAAIEGFLKKTGLTREQLKVQTNPKGEVYMAVTERAGRETALVLAEIVPEVMAKISWPKSMRWKPGMATRWVRPLHSILATFDGEVVPFGFAGVSSGRHTRGHRFLSEGKIEARRFDDYEAALKKAHVVLDAEERAAIIFEGVKQAAFVHGLDMIPDEGLLAEVSGLAEWPVIYVGSIENQFMDVPAEILQTSMRTHQKYFSLRDPKTARLANKFALIANMIAKDGGKEIVAGNERVLRARLSDAKFFWDEDRKRTLASRVDDLKGVVFHAKLGTQYERVERIEKLAGQIAAKIGADVEMAKRAARLAKADLTAGVVGEFPELQGVMGRYYALHDEEDDIVADAVRDHYKPVGPSDEVPVAPVSIAVALADKLDALTGFFAVGEKPTGSGDPFALRRAALGVIRTLVEHDLRIDLARVCVVGAFERLQENRANQFEPALLKIGSLVGRMVDTETQEQVGKALIDAHQSDVQKNYWARAMEGAKPGISLRDFILDRMEVMLRDQGVPVGVYRAARSWQQNSTDENAGAPTLHWVVEGEPAVLVARVSALQSFLKTEDGKNLLAGYKRGANILKVEEKKDGKTFLGKVDTAFLIEPAEKALHSALHKAVGAINAALAKEDFAGAMTQTASLRGPVDSFFDSVKVNADDAKLRENRLHLLAGLRTALHTVADFSKLEG
jgi:glycyl-tRNA synthetase beta chain